MYFLKIFFQTLLFKLIFVISTGALINSERLCAMRRQSAEIIDFLNAFRFSPRNVSFVCHNLVVINDDCGAPMIDDVFTLFNDRLPFAEAVKN